MAVTLQLGASTGGAPIRALPARRVLLALEVFTGTPALLAGLLLALAPDGSLLEFDPRLRAGSPFIDWRVPGILLALFVGGGLLAAATWRHLDLPGARSTSALAGVGLVAFQAVEYTYIGFHPLQVVIAFIGVLIVALALAGDQPPSTVRKASQEHLPRPLVTVADQARQ